MPSRRKVLSHGRGAIQLSLDKAHYISGDVITGSVCVNVTELIKCNVAWKEDPSDGKNEVRYCTNKRVIVAQKLVLKNTLTKLCRGEHTYSFQYQLPYGLPSTFDNHGDAGILAKIEYFIKGAVRIKGGTNQCLQNEQALLVYSNFGGSVARCKAEKECAVRLLYVIPQGKCTLRAAANKPFYCPGDVAQIQVDIQNPSRQRIRSLECRLCRQLVVAAGQIRQVKRTIYSMELPGVAAGATTTQLLSFQFARTAFQPSTEGSYIRVTYTIDIVANFAWAPNLKVRIPITVGPRRTHGPSIVDRKRSSAEKNGMTKRHDVEDNNGPDELLLKHSNVETNEQDVARPN
ncbi:hypothetical protein AeMF1_006115 [Aphanomyces euteiches]|nr:hypothetical protein AeMF1_006115 [Aphanomyces euteiches]KAH9185886.1 hypothetical protein AeNC1_012136 [Aphanomyces euteiches]